MFERYVSIKAWQNRTIIENYILSLLLLLFWKDQKPKDLWSPNI